MFYAVLCETVPYCTAGVDGVGPLLAVVILLRDGPPSGAPASLRPGTAGPTGSFPSPDGQAVGVVGGFVGLIRPLARMHKALKGGRDTPVALAGLLPLLIENTRKELRQNVTATAVVACSLQQEAEGMLKGF